LVVSPAHSSILGSLFYSDYEEETTFRRILFEWETKGGNLDPLTDPPTPAPKVEGCPDKRVYITHICDLKDIESISSTIDLTIDVIGESVWPANVDRDCPIGSFWADSYEV